MKKSKIFIKMEINRSVKTDLQHCLVIMEESGGGGRVVGFSSEVGCRRKK